MSDVYKDLEIGLQRVLNNIVGKPFIDWEGEKPYTPQNGVLFWRTTNIPGTAQFLTADIGREFPGIFRVEVFVPRDKGLKALIDNLTLIDNAYIAAGIININDTKIFIKAPFRGNTDHEPHFLHGSVKVPYIGYN